MKYSFTALALAAVASAAAVHSKEAVNPLGVSITPVSNTVVKAVITNNGDKGLNVLNKGTILDSSPVNKFKVTKDSAAAEFHGVKLRLGSKGFKAADFTALNPGESKEVTVDLAEIYGLESTGQYDVQATGSFRYAELGSTDLVSSIRFSSNHIAMNVDGHIAAQVQKAIDVAVAKRSTIVSGCSADQKNTVLEGEKRCVAQAEAAADAALNGSATKFKEYFKSTDSTLAKDRKLVHDRLTAVANECQATPGGILKVHCDDIYSNCDDGTFAYTVPSKNDVVWCNQYWTHDLETTQCHGDDKTGTTIHEYTHADSVFSPGTDDHAYGYNNCIKLNNAQALENADTYEYFANAIHLGC